ncbi:MAG: hypothetical protein JO093_20155 [Acidobacteria bacterium]|nr:hypothetical protein [Acidobacteriota bacterium]MBV9070007.1 hypothetical protein [Acidobacteriota bacterium]MBV9187938.1 hypothetical protein [Acidobacteriota bacterium]
MIWIIVPLFALVIFGLYVRREAARLRAEDLRPRILVKLKLAGNGMATPAELHERQALEAEIEKRGIGSIADTGSGDGWATLQVSVVDPNAAAEQVRDLLREQDLFDRAEVSA